MKVVIFVVEKKTANGAKLVCETGKPSETSKARKSIESEVLKVILPLTLNVAVMQLFFTKAPLFKKLGALINFSSSDF